MWLPFSFAYYLFHPDLKKTRVWGRAPRGDSKRKRGGLIGQNYVNRKVFYSEKNQ